MLDKNKKEELKGLRCLYSVAQQKQEEDRREIEKWKTRYDDAKEQIIHWGLPDMEEEKAPRNKLHQIQANYKEVMEKYGDPIRERVSLYEDKKRFEEELISLRADYNDLVKQYTENAHNKHRLESEVDRLKTTLQEKDNTKEVQTGIQTIFKGELEHILKSYYGYSEVLLLNYMPIDIQYKGAGKE